MTPQTLLTGLNTAYWTLDFTAFCHLTGLEETHPSLELFQHFQSASKDLCHLDPIILERLVHHQIKQAA
ncbi:MAG: hypothetical protein HC924_08430 [Synechococcaceae cyanobacterium SM2_3_2]|nr:hypothetical protein [Synechococcaceae cyanobacterium SM2_3_2]